MVITVYDENGNPLAGIPVYAYDSSLTPPGYTYVGLTDANGHITIPNGYGPSFNVSINPSNDPNYNALYFPKTVIVMGDTSVPLNPK